MLAGASKRYAVAVAFLGHEPGTRADWQRLGRVGHGTDPGSDTAALRTSGIGSAAAVAPSVYEVR